MNHKKVAFSLIFLVGIFLPSSGLFYAGTRAMPDSKSAIAANDARALNAEKITTLLSLKMRFWEAFKEGSVQPAEVITSSYLRPTVTASIFSRYDLDEEKAQISRVFNLKDVKLMTEADLNWASEKGEKIFHIFRLDGKEYLVLVTPSLKQPVGKEFRIEVAEYKGDEKVGFKSKQPGGKEIEISVPKRDNWTSLLDTEINLPEKNIAVFGFEDTQGKPYFLSFHVTGIGGVLGGVVGGVVGGVLGGIEGGVKGGVEGGVAGGVASEEELAEFAKGAVKAEGHFAPPKLVKFVEPVYPEIARVAQVEGVVVLSARTDINGRVENIKVLRSVPLLDQAAIDAVRQWVYEPGLVKGKPMPFVFTLTVQFRLDGQKGKGKVQTSAMSGIVTEKSDEEFAKGAVKCEGEIKPPQLLKRVEPVYPLDAKKAKVEGVVILAVRTDIKGKITAIKVLRAVPALDQAAIDAVGQWIYEPLIVEGQPKPAVFTVTVRFHLIK